VLHIKTCILSASPPLAAFPAFAFDINMGLFSPIANFFSSIYIFLWDTVLVLGNLILPKRRVGWIVPDGHPGFGGNWPQHIPAKEGDSRCSCPALNALANHG
jgi:hypothetical protein